MMTRRVRTLARRTPALLLLAAAAACARTQAQAPARSHASLRQEIEQLNERLSAALERGDALAAAAFYADDAMVRSPRGPVAQGRAAIDRYFERIGRAHEWRLDVFDVGGHPDAPYQIGRSTLIHGADPDTSVVDFVLYWRRQPDGRLRILLDYYHR